MSPRSRAGSGSGGARDYPRTARLNRLLQEIIGDELEQLENPRLEQTAITNVVVEPDLRHATVYYDTLEGEAADDEVLEVLRSVRVRLQSAIARQARLKRTPELAFRPDLAVRGGERIDEILRGLGDGEPAREGDGDDAVPDADD
jgi:ribosome-binding factor A